MQVVDDSPADILHSASYGHHGGYVASCHLHQLTQTDHKSCCRHNGNDCHQHLSQFLEKIKIDPACKFTVLTSHCVIPPCFPFI